MKHYSYEVCSDHFEESDMKTIRQLHPFVVPTKNIKPKSSASTSGSNIKIANVSSLVETVNPEPEDKKDGATKNLSKLNPESFVIKQEYLAEDPLSFDHGDTGEDIREEYKTLFNLRNILRTKFKGNDTIAYKKFALKLYNSSSYMYASLQPWLKLPSKSTLNRLPIIVPPKLDDATWESLSMKIKSLPAKAKYCSICVDEIELQANLYYDLRADEIFGFEIKDNVIFPANYAYIIVLQSLYFDWKQPITYTFSAAAKTHTELDVFITEAVTKLFTLEISITGLIINEKQIFQKYAAAKKVTIGRPYFFIEGRIIYLIFDVPSLLKCLHLDLITTRFYDSNNKQIWWEFIKFIYSDQQSKYIKLTPKLTSAHIKPVAKKMTVEHSAQIFSNAVSTALETYIAFGAISKEAKSTATFIKSVNDLFDVLNSDKDKANAGMTTEQQAKILGEGHIMFSNMKTSEVNSKEIRTCQLFLVTIQSMQHLFEELKVDKCSQFYTRRLNQDCIVDILKSAKKGEGDSTAIQLTRAFSKCFRKSILQTNPCQKLDTTEIFEMAEHIMTKEISCPPPSVSLVSLQGETDYRLELPVKNVIMYVASYLMFKCSEQHQCPTFQRKLTSMLSFDDGNVLFNSYKNINKQASFYGKLKLPVEEFIQYICKLEEVLCDNFLKHIEGKLGSSLYELLYVVPKFRLCLCFPSEYLIKLFIRLRIYHALHFKNDLYTSGDDAKSLAIIIKTLIL